jgi:hypothetical protein
MRWFCSVAYGLRVVTDQSSETENVRFAFKRKMIKNSSQVGF